MNKVKGKTKKTTLTDTMQMTLVNPYAAGIDIGDKEIVVAVPAALSDEPVRTFGTMTCNLSEIVEFLKSCEIDTVAMESTGVYWKPLFSLLVRNEFETFLVNARHVKNVTGRKTDESDAMWIQRLHSCGLLNSSYLPDDEQEALRTVVRYRRTLIQDSCRFVNRMEKSLELMNIKFHTIISDITGKSGKAVVNAIINGERDAINFLPHIHPRIKADKEVIVKSLEGNWREEHLFTLKESFEMYELYKQRLVNCDKEIEKYLQKCEARENEGEIKPAEEKKKNPAKKATKNRPHFDVRTYLAKIHGVDIMAIDGISETGGMELLAETGTDMSKWKTEAHFISWLNLCPNNKISGGKLISSKVLMKKANAASQVFRAAANAIQRSNIVLGDYFRRMKAKGGNKYAIIATARKIAAIYYKMLRNKEEFKPMELDDYQQKFKNAKIAYLERTLRKLKQEAA